MIKFNTLAELMLAVDSGKYFKGNQGPNSEDWYVTFEIIDDLKNKEILQEDINNRKTDWDDRWEGGIEEHVNAIVDNMYPPAVGMASAVAATINGKRVLMFCDFHNRSTSLATIRTKQPALWEKIKDCPVVLRIVREGQGGRMNAALNRQISHSARQKLLNKELAFGKIIDDIREATKDYDSGFPKAAWLLQLAYAIWLRANNRLDSTVSYYDFLRTKKDIRPLLDIPKGQKIFKNYDDKVRDEIIVAVRAALETRKLMQTYWSSKQTDGEINDELKKLLRSAYWFGFLLKDALTDCLIVSRYDDDMAQRIEMKGSQFVEWVLNLETPENEGHIRTVLRVFNKLSKKALKSTKGSKMYKSVLDEVLAKKELV